RHRRRRGAAPGRRQPVLDLQAAAGRSRRLGAGADRRRDAAADGRSRSCRRGAARGRREGGDDRQPNPGRGPAHDGPAQALSERPPMRLLVTGFGPFGGHAVNPSEQVVRALAAAPDGPAAAILPVSYRRAWAELEPLLADGRPDALIAFGLAAEADRV